MTQPDLGRRAPIYVSTDVETDGPIPGRHSLLSIGSAAFTASGEMLTTFSANLAPLPGAAGHPDTMKFWAQHPDQLAIARRHPDPPEQVMAAYAAWIAALPGDPILVAYPAGFDFAWVSWYFHAFVGHCPFGHAALDMKSFAMARLGTDFATAGRAAWPASWQVVSEGVPHVALDDAIEQGRQFCAMLADPNPMR